MIAKDFILNQAQKIPQAALCSTALLRLNGATQQKLYSSTTALATKKIALVAASIFCMLMSFAQPASAPVRKGNQLYKQKNFEVAEQEYEKALSVNPKEPVAHYNTGNAKFRLNKTEEAVSSYDAAIDNSKKKDVKQKAFYNKGVALSKQQKLAESISAWKEALKLNPQDAETRENLQKALMELKKQQQQQQKENDKKQQQQQQKQPKPEQQQSRLNKQQVEQLLKAMQQKEKEIQQKLQRGNASPDKPEKDW